MTTTQQIHFISDKQLKYIGKLGNGQYGIVTKAEWKQNNGNIVS